MNLIEKALYLLICVYMIILPLIPSQITIKYIHLIPNLILVLIIVTFIVNTLISKESRNHFIIYLKDFFRDYMGIFLTLMITIMLLSVSYSTDKRLALSESLRFLTYVFLYFIIKYSIKVKENIKSILITYIFIISIISILGLLQYFTGYGLEHKFVFTYGTVASDRIAATLENPNNLGVFLVMGFFPFIMLMLNEKNKKKKVVYIILILIILFDIFATFSRNSWIGLLIGSFVLTIIYNWKVLIGLGGVGLISLFVPQISGRFISALSISSNSDRVKLWETAVKMFKEHPLTGVGNGNYITLYDTYVNKYAELKYLDYSHFPSHNSYLKVLSELGVFGAAAFIGIITGALIKLKKLLNITEDAYYKAFFTGFLASCIAFLVMNFFDNMFFIPNTVTYFWIFIALADNLLYRYKNQLK